MYMLHFHPKYDLIWKPWILTSQRYIGFCILSCIYSLIQGWLFGHLVTISQDLKLRKWLEVLVPVQDLILTPATSFACAWAILAIMDYLEAGCGKAWSSRWKILLPQVYIFNPKFHINIGGFTTKSVLIQTAKRLSTPWIQSREVIVSQSGRERWAKKLTTLHLMTFQWHKPSRRQWSTELKEVYPDVKEDDEVEAEVEKEAEADSGDDEEVSKELAREKSRTSLHDSPYVRPM